MSIRAVDIVLRAPIRPAALKLTAAVMAYVHNGKTGLLNPSLSFIAAQVGIDRRQAQRYVRALIDMRLVSVIANALGGKPGTTPHYRMHLDRIAALTPTGDAGATPTGGADHTGTGGADVTPTPGQTGGADDADGWCTRRGGVVYMTQTGGVGTTLTGKEPEGTGIEPGLQLGAFESAAPAVAGPRPWEMSMAASKVPSKAKTETKTGATWEAYAAAYRARYGTDPVRNAKVNGQLGRLVDRLGADESPKVARFYVEHNGEFYARKMHSADTLLADAEKLRTEWATGRVAPERAVAAAPPRGRKPVSFAGIDYTEGVVDGRIV